MFVFDLTADIFPMSQPKPSSLRWLSLAVLVPVMGLAVLAAIGTQAQIRAAWSEARDEAKRLASDRATLWDRMLDERIQHVALYPALPLPGAAAAADDILDGKDVAALAKLRDDPAAGISPAGLPRRVLAALKMLEIDPAAQPAGAVATLVTRECPSILTLTALTKLASPERAAWLAQWRLAEQAREIFRHHPTAGWLQSGGHVWWTAPAQDGLQYIAPEGFEEIQQLTRRNLPPWAEMRLACGQLLLAGPAAGELLASTPLTLHDDLRLEVIATRPALVEAGAHQQARWTLGLLAFATVMSTGGLMLIRRVVKREQRLNAMKSDFVASVSHELRAPVASIRLMADALEAGKIAPTTICEFHQLISRESTRLSALIENVLDFSRLERGRRHWQFAECDPATILLDCLRVMEPIAAERQITLSITPGPPVDLTVIADAGAIHQALVNLLDNAIKFSPAGAAVTIELSVDETLRRWRISITDQGPGIAAAEHQRIFERFHRLGSEMRRETQGTGIGLSVVKAIAEAHHGSVTLRSQPGHGSTFVLSIPLQP